MKHLIVIAGPTAIGKTNLSIRLASQFKSEIFSADSRQLFNELSIGTAKPSQTELAATKHHFINELSVAGDYSAGQFEKDALERLGERFKQHNVLFLVGGSGLYINAVCQGFDAFPEIDPQIRLTLNAELEEQGIGHLQQLLQQADPDYYKTVDLNNPMRLTRALEIYRGTGKPYSSYLNKAKAKRPFNIVKIALDMDREALYKRINTRVDTMIEQGLIDEVKQLMPYKNKAALQTVGYQELFDYFDGRANLDKAIDLIKQNSRRYAKRQLTWLRRDQDYKWFKPDVVEEIANYISGNIL